MPKKLTSYTLSDDCLELLDNLSQTWHMSKTAVLEHALKVLQTQYAPATSLRPKLRPLTEHPLYEQNPPFPTSSAPVTELEAVEDDFTL